MSSTEKQYQWRNVENDFTVSSRLACLVDAAVAARWLLTSYLTGHVALFTGRGEKKPQVCVSCGHVKRQKRQRLLLLVLSFITSWVSLLLGRDTCDAAQTHLIEKKVVHLWRDTLNINTLKITSHHLAWPDSVATGPQGTNARCPPPPSNVQRG